MSGSLSLYTSGYREFSARDKKPADITTVRDVFHKTHEFIATSNVTFDNPDLGLESLQSIPKLIANKSESFALEYDKLQDFVKGCNVPVELQDDCAVEVARILQGGVSSAHLFLDKGRDNAKPIPLRQLYGPRSVGMMEVQANQAMESFGEYSDKVTSDSRLAVASTVLRAHRSLIDRVLPRRPTEDPVVLIKIPSPEAYNLSLSQNLKASVRYQADKQPLIALYRDPSLVNTTPQVINPLKSNDSTTSPVLLQDGVILPQKVANLFDLTLSTNTVGYNAVDWTDLVSEGGSIGYILLQASSTVAGVTTTEVFKIDTQYMRSAAFVTQTNVRDSGDRAANLRVVWTLNSASLQANGAATAIFGAFTNVNEMVDISFNADLNIKNSYVNGSGSWSTWLQTELPGGVPNAIQTAANEITFTIIGWSPYLFFSEENMRKTTGAVRMNFREIEFLIPVGRNFIVDYSLMNQEVSEEVTSVVSEVISIGNSARSVTILDDTLNSVFSRLNYEANNPNVDWYTSVAQDFAAGTLSLPHVVVGSLNISGAQVMRESERLSDVHSYITSRLLAYIADGHNKSMYTEQFEAGERARYKIVTSGPIAEILFGIDQYWNTLDDKEAVAKESYYSLKLPNGTRLDIIKSNFEYYANRMMVIPVRDAKPDDITSFGVILDRGTFTGQYTPVSNGAANKRIVANSREILFPTNPLGYLFTVVGIQAQLQVLTDSSGLM